MRVSSATGGKKVMMAEWDRHKALLLPGPFSPMKQKP